MEIEVGDYIRTTSGKIDKIIKIYMEDTDLKNVVRGENGSYWKEKIVNHSKNILDLIEVGDIVELEYYVAKYRRRISRKFECQILENKIIYFDNRHCSFCYDFELKKWRDGKGYNPKIKTILTHEQYTQNCYRLEG